MLEDVIYSISPTETPFTTMASRKEATAVLHELTKAAHVKPSLIDLDARWGNKAEAEMRRERLSEKAREGSDSPNMRNK
ncbi:MAG: hypothetical protein EPO08_03905 [Rhodospirillaceae bacterium]|nr:MAG: hypothetical protein EPO08_03905 [Rhodospirillaceae bacterium]